MKNYRDIIASLDPQQVSQYGIVVSHDFYEYLLDAHAKGRFPLHPDTIVVGIVDSTISAVFDRPADPTQRAATSKTSRKVTQRF